MAARLEITLKSHLFDAEGASLIRKVTDYFGRQVGQARSIHILTLDTKLSREELEAVRRDIFTNPVTQVSSLHRSEDTTADTPHSSLLTPHFFQWAIWVGLRPGVRDTAGSVAVEAIAEYLGRSLGPDEAVYTSQLFFLAEASLDRGQVETIAKELLANDIIQQWRVYSRSEWDPEQGVGFILPKVLLAHVPTVAEVPIPSDEALMQLSKERNLALNPRDIPVIRDYFSRPAVLESRRSVGLSAPTDVELEMISQARSDHCNHNTFQGKFHYYDLRTGKKETVDNLFKTCIKAPTLEVKSRKDWVISVLWDNAGVARFDENYYYAVKGETHNSPSNMEAYGGSLTGIVGIYRDIMGVGKGARLIGGLYGYCVGPRDYTGSLHPHLHPRRLLDGVIEGVKDGGNKHGVPTHYGNLFFHPSYLGKCLVFVGALGIMPKEVLGEPTEQKHPQPGDLIIMSGGRVGKDGIHGVTASSETYSEHTPAGHVQIGDPYTQKKMHDFLLEARDEGLMTFITDNGGGGLSSSVGESAHMAGGAVVQLDKVPLKYEGLDVWEIWVSESQERMTMAVKPDCLERFMELSRKHEVESTVIGHYEATGKLRLIYNGKTCAYLDLSFFAEDFPQWEFDAHWMPPEDRGLYEPVLAEPIHYGKLLHRLLAGPNLSSREWIQRQYDHEVQGSSVVKLLVGRDRDVPNDAVVLRPVLESNRGLSVTQTWQPRTSAIDAYDMITGTLDEAVRRLIAVGGKLDTIGGVDNFCWPSVQHDPVSNPDGRLKAAQLVRATWALRDMCLAYGIPLLSGKDSMYVDGHLSGDFGERHKVSGLPTMQFTATSVVPDIEHCLTMEAKTPGDLVYILGTTTDELGASEYYELLGYTGLHTPKVHPQRNISLYEALQKAIEAKKLASCHGIYSGGLAVHAAMVAFAGHLGMTLDVTKIPREGVLREDHLLFSESCGRFLVTVPAGRKEDFERHFQNLPFALVGEVTEEPRLIIRGEGGKTLLDESVFHLKESWQQDREGVKRKAQGEKNRENVSRRAQGDAPLTPHASRLTPSALVLTGFGLNCDLETAYALELAGIRAERVHLNSIISGEKKLQDYQFFVIGGGFSWADEHGAGVILAMRLKNRLGEDLLRFVDQGGLVLGICNGFQVLVNLGLLPAFEAGAFKREVALITNDCGNFRDQWVHLAVNPSSPCVFTMGMDNIELPVRHGEGKFYAESDVIEKLERNHQLVLHYALPDGRLAQRAFPHNPNGSLRDIAGICDPTGRIFGLMPHPEAFNHLTNHPDWAYQKERNRDGKGSLNQEGEGIRIFRNAAKYFK